MGIILIFFSSFGYLLSRAYGAVAPYRDSGDLIAAASCLGIAHPPGYSFYTLLTHAGMGLIPLGNLAYRANLLSCLWAALAAAVVFKALKSFAGRGAAFLAAAVWALSPAVQRLSLVSEMYTLHALFCAVILHRACRSEMVFKDFAFLSCLIGLAVINQPTVIFVIPGLLILSKWRNLPLMGIFGLIGFSLAIYYPLRSMREPLVDWGNPENLRNFWRLLTRADYGGLKLHPEESVLSWSASDVWEQVKFFLVSEKAELGWLAAGAALVGLALDFKKPKRLSFFLGATFLISGPAFFVLSNLPIHEETSRSILEPYLLMTNLFALPWIALGFEKIFSAFRLGPVIPAAAFLAHFLLFRTPAENRRHDFLAWDYGKNLMRTMPVNSSLFEPDDTTAFVLSSLQVAEGKRTDLTLLMGLRTRWGYEQIMERRPDLLLGMSFGDASSFIKALLARHLQTGRPLFADHASKFPQVMDNHPEGLLVRAGSGAVPDFVRRQEVWQFMVERGDADRLCVDQNEEFFTRHLLSRVSAAMNNNAIAWQSYGRYDLAEDQLKRAILRDPYLDPAWINLGYNAYFQKDYPKTKAVFALAIGHFKGNAAGLRNVEQAFKNLNLE